jgi:hypothetical protein
MTDAANVFANNATEEDQSKPLSIKICPFLACHLYGCQRPPCQFNTKKGRRPTPGRKTRRYDIAEQVRVLGADSLLPTAKKRKPTPGRKTG